jgi:metal-responsive CopG/Arc/MetJ family transcriptional regulator
VHGIVCARNSNGELKVKRFNLELADNLYAAIDEFRKRQPGAIPSRAEVVRRFVEAGLKAEKVEVVA